MERINLNLSAHTILNRRSAFTLARLRANPDLTAELAQAQAAHDAVATASQGRDAAERETMAAASVRDEQRYTLSVALRALHAAVVAEVRNNRLCNAYRVLFPDGFSALLAGSAGDELTAARELVSKLADPQSAEIKDALARVNAGIDLLATALADLDTARTAEKAAAAALLTEKARFSSNYDEIYSALVKDLGNWRLAETYFYHKQRSTGTGPSKPASGAQPTPQTVTAVVTPVVSPVATSVANPVTTPVATAA